MAVASNFFNPSKEASSLLVLSRKDGQSILIGDNIRVTIIGNSRGKTQVGIEAPNEVAIVREELNKLDEKGNDDAVL